MKSLEELTHHNFFGNYFIPIIIGVAVHIFYTPAVFEGFRFWIRGYSHIIWATVWFALYFYWNTCIIYLLINKRDSKKRDALILYPFAVLGISFIVSVVYTLILVRTDPGNYSAIMDAPSIWCTFFAMQILFVPYLFKKIIDDYDVKIHGPNKSINFRDHLILIVITIVALVLFYYLVPQFSDFVIKYVFR